MNSHEIRHETWCTLWLVKLFPLLATGNVGVEQAGPYPEPRDMISSQDGRRQRMPMLRRRHYPRESHRATCIDMFVPHEIAHWRASWCEVHDFQDGVCGARSIHEDSNFNCARVDGIALFLESSFPQKVSCLAVSSVNSDEYFPAASAAVSYVASISKSRKWRLSIVAPCCFQTRFFIEAAFKREQQMCKEEGINIDLKFQDESRGGFGFGHYPGQSEIS